MPHPPHTHNSLRLEVERGIGDQLTQRPHLASGVVLDRARWDERAPSGAPWVIEIVTRHLTAALAVVKRPELRRVRAGDGHWKAVAAT